MIQAWNQNSTLTSYARPSASLATVSLARSPSPSSLSMASSVPIINVPGVGGKVRVSTVKKENLITTKLQTERGRGGGLSEAPSSGRFPSCSLKRGTLGRGWGADGGCTWGMSSPSLRLASMSCSLDRLGPVHRSDYQLTHSDGERREKLRLETEKSANKLKEEKKDENGRKTPTGRKENW